MRLKPPTTSMIGRDTTNYATDIYEHSNFRIKLNKVKFNHFCVGNGAKQDEVLSSILLIYI